MGRHSWGVEHQNFQYQVPWGILWMDVSGLFEDTWLSMGRFRREYDYARTSSG